MKYIVPLVALAWLSGCATQETIDTDVETDAVTGAKVRRERINLPQNVACADPAQLTNTRTPPELYGGLVRCIQEDRLNTAVSYFAMAGTYTAYDTYRVGELDHRTLHTQLPLRVRELVGEKKWRDFWNVATQSLNHPDGLAAVCREVRTLGAPRYAPRYMSPSTPAQNVEDNAPVFFNRALETYLHCPKR